MKILVLGDSHCDSTYMGRAVRVAARENCEAILQLGDFGYLEHVPEGRAFLQLCEFYCQEKGIDLYWIDGNHDNHELLWKKYGLDRHGISEGEFLDIRPHIHYAPRGHRWTWEGTTFLACGGAYSVDKNHRNHGMDWWPTEEITWAQANACIDGGPVHVMVSHDCPTGFSLPALAYRGERPEAEGNRKMLEGIVRAVRPNLLLHGHYHSRYGGWYDLGRKKMRIEGLGSNRDENQTPWFVLDLAHSEGTVSVASVPAEVEEEEDVAA